MKNTEEKYSFPRSCAGMQTWLKSSRAHDQAAKPQSGMDSHGRPWKPEKRGKEAE